MSNVDTHRAAHEAFNRRDLEGAARPLRNDAVYTDHPRGLSVKGPQEFVDWMQGWVTTMSNAQVTEVRYIDGGDHSVAIFRGRGVNDGPLGTLPPSGRELDMPFCEVFRYDPDGGVISGEVFYDQATLLTQLGHMEPPR
ncbi:MAG: ester cyclase [Micromonosporaceae bacterium]